jgi:hypothetical protein
MRSLASAPKISSSSPPMALMPPVLRAQSSRPVSASTQPTAAWNERAQTRVPSRTGGPIRSARRSTSLLPRGVPTGTSQRSAPRVGSMPARRGPWPATSVSFTPVSTPMCSSVSASPGRCSVHSLWPSPLSKACTARSTPITKTRAPATSGAVLTREFSCMRQASLPPSITTSLLSVVTTAWWRPSLPTPADSSAPTSKDHSWRPVAASSASTVPPLEATTKMPSRTATASGKRTPSTLADHTCRPAILGVTGSSGLGLGLSAAQPASSSAASSQPLPSAAARRGRITAQPPRPWRRQPAAHPVR